MWPLTLSGQDSDDPWGRGRARSSGCPLAGPGSHTPFFSQACWGTPGGSWPPGTRWGGAGRRAGVEAMGSGAQGTRRLSGRCQGLGRTSGRCRLIRVAASCQSLGLTLACPSPHLAEPPSCSVPSCGVPGGTSHRIRPELGPACVAVLVVGMAAWLHSEQGLPMAARQVHAQATSSRPTDASPLPAPPTRPACLPAPTAESRSSLINDSACNCCGRTHRVPPSATGSPDNFGASGLMWAPRDPCAHSSAGLA